VQIADVLTWTDVADAFRGSYSTEEPLPDDLEAQIATIASASADPAVRAVRALRLVQGGLRYQAVNVGDGGYVPRPVDRIWASRSGDCKDASRLLTALLRRLGVESDPVLVNTAIGVVLDQSLPHMSAFDHCIVGLRIEGVRYWVDPTQFPQGGRLGILHQARFGWALPLVANAKLEDMGQAPFAQSFNLLERFELPSQPSLPGRLTLSTA
jgi:transglutaminase-like putative cysteine protease